MMLQSKTGFMMPEQFENSIYGQVSDLQDKLLNLEEEKRVVEIVINKLKFEPNRLEVYRLLPEMLGKSYEFLVTDKINDLLSLLEQKENLLYQVTEEHTGVQSLNKRIQLKSQSIIKSLNVINDRLKEDINNAKRKILQEE